MKVIRHSQELILHGYRRRNRESVTATRSELHIKRVECHIEPWRAKHSTRVCAILHGMVVTDSISYTMHENLFGTLLKYKIYMKTKISDHLQPAGAHLSLHKFDCYVTVTSSLHVWSAE